MSIDFSISPNPCAFGSVPAKRTKYARISIQVGDPFGLSRDVKIRVKRSLGSSTCYQPLAVLGWTASGDAVESPVVKMGGPNTPTVHALVSLLDITPSGPLFASLQIEVIDAVTGKVLEGGQTICNLSGTIIAAQTVTLVIAIDHSSSMGEILDGEPRIRRAVAAAGACLALMEDSDKLGVVAFAGTASEVLSIGRLDALVGTRTRRQVARTLFDPMVLDPAFATPPGLPTSIYSGVVKARLMLNFSGALDKNLLVLSDGLEDYGASVTTLPQNADTYAMGLPPLGTTALGWLASTQGYLSVTGAVTGDTLFKVQKYAAQIFANVSNSAIVVDPELALPDSPQAFFDVEFSATELDHEFKVVVFAPDSDQLELQALANTEAGAVLVGQAPVGQAPVGHASADAAAAARASHGKAAPPETAVESGNRLSAERGKQAPSRADLNDAVDGKLPMLRGQGSLLTRIVNEPDAAGGRSFTRRVRLTRASSAQPGKVTPFSYAVVAKSDLLLDAQVHATSLCVGGELLLSAVIFEAGLPIEERGSVRAEICYPDGGRSALTLTEMAAGRFSASIQTLRPGTYEIRFTAIGKTVFGSRFRREQVRTVIIQPARC